MNIDSIPLSYIGLYLFLSLMMMFKWNDWKFKGMLSRYNVLFCMVSLGVIFAVASGLAMLYGEEISDKAVFATFLPLAIVLILIDQCLRPRHK